MSSPEDRAELAPQNPFDAIRRVIIDADTATVVEAAELVEPIDRSDLAARAEYVAAVSRLAGKREGLAIARLALEDAVKNRPNY